MGNAGLAMAGDLSVRNPASLSFLEGTVLSLGSTVVMPRTAFRPAGGQPEVKMQNQVLFPPTVALSFSLGKGFAFGISGTFPYAIKTEWQDDWAGAYEAVRTDMRIVYVTPSLAFRLSPEFSLGLGLNLGFPRLQMSRRIFTAAASTPDRLESFDGTGHTGYGLTAGLLLRPSKGIGLAFSYTSRMRLNVDDAKVTYSGFPDSLADRFPLGEAQTSVTTPDIISGGVSAEAFPWLRLEANASYTLWSTIQSFDVSSTNPVTGSTRPLYAVPFNWKNSWSLYAGLEIPLPGVDLRGGYVFEQSPSVETYFTPAIPDANRRGFSAGIGYWVSEGLRLDFAYQFLRFDDRQVNINAQSAPEVMGLRAAGTYRTDWTVVGISVSYLWD